MNESHQVLVHVNIDGKGESSLPFEKPKKLLSVGHKILIPLSACGDALLTSLLYISTEIQFN